MKAFFGMFRRSAGELKSVRCLAVTGILLAVFVVLRSYTSIQFGTVVRINFAFLALAAIAMLYGPVVAMIAAIPGDVLSAIILGGGPSGLLPGLTLVWVFNGLVYGVFLYRFELKKSFWSNARLIIAHAMVVFIGRMVLNTSILYYYGILGADGSTVQTLISVRVITNLVAFPIDLAVLYLMLVPIKLAYMKTIGRQI